MRTTAAIAMPIGRGKAVGNVGYRPQIKAAIDR